jgi:NADPH:quinone reductase
MRELPGKGVDGVLDGLGGALSVRSFRALRPGGRLVVFGHSATLVQGHKSWRGWIEWYGRPRQSDSGVCSRPTGGCSLTRIQKLREGHQVLPMGARRPLPVGVRPRNPESFREDFRVLLELLREGKIHPVVAERLPLTEARRAHELLDSSAAKGKLVLVP